MTAEPNPDKKIYYYIVAKSKIKMELIKIPFDMKWLQEHAIKSTNRGYEELLWTCAFEPDRDFSQ